MASSVVMFCSFAELMSRKQRCGYLKKDKSPCGRAITRASQDLVESHLAKIASNAASLSESFTSLAQIAFCGPHLKTRDAARAEEQWYDEWNSTGHGTEQENELATELHSLSLRVNTSLDETSFHEFDEEVLPSPMTYSSMVSPSKALRKVLNTPPNERSKGAGFVYIIALDDSPGLFKVGYTVNPEVRTQKHKKCHKNIRLLDKQLTAWAPRVEKLVHAELSTFQLRQSKKCHNCETLHREIFRVSEKEIREVLYKWIGFFIENHNPYNEDGTLNEQVKLPYPASGDEFPESTPTKKGPKKSRMSTMSSKKYSTKDEDEDEVFSQKTGVSRLNLLGSQLSGLNLKD